MPKGDKVLRMPATFTLDMGLLAWLERRQQLSAAIGVDRSKASMVEEALRLYKEQLEGEWHEDENG